LAIMGVQPGLAKCFETGAIDCSAHNGTIDFTSDPVQGKRFTVRLALPIQV
jgi:hypothetical protein